MKRKLRSGHTRLKTKLGLPDLENAKIAVIVSLRSFESQRSYRHSIDEFVAWYCSAPRLSFNKAVVLRYRLHLEDRHLAAGTINVRLAAVRRLAAAPIPLARMVSWRLSAGPITRILQTHYCRICFVARSISRISEFSRNRSNTMRLASGVISKVRIAAGLLSWVKRRERIVLRSSSQKSCPAIVFPSM